MMKVKAVLLAAVSVIALGGGWYYFERSEGSPPPILTPYGEATDDGWIVDKKTIDYEAIVRSALENEASFLTLTVKRDMVRDQSLEASIDYTPFPASRARVRVKYHVEYPIGYVLKRFSVSGGALGITITLPRPSLIARPSVRIQSYEILERGILIDEKTALLELQKRIQPDVEKRAPEVLRRRDVIPRSERALRSFLVTILKQQGTPPPITFRYR